MWALYEKRIDQYLVENQLKVTCASTRASVRHDTFVTDGITEVFPGDCATGEPGQTAGGNSRGV